MYSIKCCTEIKAYDTGEFFIFYVGPNIVTNI